MFVGEVRWARPIERLADRLFLYGEAWYNYQGWIVEGWNAEGREHLVRAQKRGDAMDGSWDPSGPWTETGGRVLSTCFATLTLEVYYRYLPLYWRADRLPEAR